MAPRIVKLSVGLILTEWIDA